MRPWPLAPVLVLLALPASAAAQVEAPVDPAGGVEYGVDPRPLEVERFRLTPARLEPGGRTTVRVRVDGGLPRARLAVTLVAEGRRRPAAVLDLGTRRTGRTIRVPWTPQRLRAGRYVARLQVAAPGRRTLAHEPTGQRTVGVRVVEPPPPPPAAAPPPPAPPSGARGVFPIRGPYSFGGAGSRFGASRNGHVHEGQDLSAPEGTPLVSPYDGTVFWRAVQDGGAGHYLIVRDAKGWDYVFMHLQAGSELVRRGDAVRAGQQIGRVGSTGSSTGPHLHFEVWPGGWQVPGSEPIDPFPLLQAWARGSG